MKTCVLAASMILLFSSIVRGDEFSAYVTKVEPGKIHLRKGAKGQGTEEVLAVAKKAGWIESTYNAEKKEHSNVVSKKFDHKALTEMVEQATNMKKSVMIRAITNTDGLIIKIYVCCWRDDGGNPKICPDAPKEGWK